MEPEHDLTPAEKEMLANDEVLKCISAVRARLKLTLREAKDLVDQFR